MHPFKAVNEMDEPIYKVAYQFGHRVLTREFPQTPDGLERANKHIRELNEKLRTLAKLVPCAPQS